MGIINVEVSSPVPGAQEKVTLDFFPILLYTPTIIKTTHSPD